MATNLIKAGHHLVVHDRTDAAQRLASQHPNVTICAAPSEVASHPGMHVLLPTLALTTSTGLAAIITMLPSAAAVQDVYTGPTGMLSAPGGVTAPLLIDSSTIDPGTTRTVPVINTRTSTNVNN